MIGHHRKSIAAAHLILSSASEALLMSSRRKTSRLEYRLFTIMSIRRSTCAAERGKKGNCAGRDEDHRTRLWVPQLSIPKVLAECR